MSNSFFFPLATGFQGFAQRFGPEAAEDLKQEEAAETQQSQMASAIVPVQPEASVALAWVQTVAMCAAGGGPK